MRTTRSSRRSAACRGTGFTGRARLKLIQQIAAEEPALVLLDSGKTDSLYTMAGTWTHFLPDGMRMAFLTHENYDLLYRLLQSGPVTMKYNLQNTLTDKPVPASITVAEIKGSEHPERAGDHRRPSGFVGPGTGRAG